MLCKNCGKKAENDSAFCQECNTNTSVNSVRSQSIDGKKQINNPEVSDLSSILITVKKYRAVGTIMFAVVILITAIPNIVAMSNFMIEQKLLFGFVVMIVLLVPLLVILLTLKKYRGIGQGVFAITVIIYESPPFITMIYFMIQRRFAEGFITFAILLVPLLTIMVIGEIIRSLLKKFRAKKIDSNKINIYYSSSSNSIEGEEKTYSIKLIINVKKQNNEQISLAKILKYTQLKVLDANNQAYFFYDKECKYTYLPDGKTIVIFKVIAKNNVDLKYLYIDNFVKRASLQ